MCEARLPTKSSVVEVAAEARASNLLNQSSDCQRRLPMQGLNVIHLLTQNDIADFHTKRESLQAEALDENLCIKHLERCLTEACEKGEEKVAIPKERMIAAALNYA